MGAAGARAARSEPPLSACLVRRGAAGRSRAAAGGARKPPGAGHSARRGGRGPGRRPSPDRCRPCPLHGRPLLRRHGGARLARGGRDDPVEPAPRAGERGRRPPQPVPDGARSPAAVAAVLVHLLAELVNEDGGHRSRCPTVHGLVLADYLEVIALLLAANDDVPLWARKRVKAMADFLARLLHPDGEVPLFHGAALGVARPARELLATAAIVLHEPELAPPGDLPGVWPLLVVGDAGRRTHAHLPRRREGVEARALRRTGFYILPGGPGDVLLLDGESPPAEGHDGVFGYELSVGGMRIVVDAGAPGEQPAPWAEYFRSTRAHNVVSVAGAEQRANGRVPAVSDVHWVARDGLLYFSGTHDGFARLALDLRLSHRRRVFCLPGRFWLVCDELLGSGQWDVASFIHFPPEVRLVAACHGHPAFVASRSEAAAVEIVPAGVGEIRMTGGVETPAPQGWYAARHGERRPAPVISLAASVRLPFVFGYALVPRADGPTAVHFEHDAFRLHARLSPAGVEYRMTVVQGDVEIVAHRL